MTKDLKIEILLFYYDRPRMAMNFAVSSVFNNEYSNWSLSVIDDSSDQNAEHLIKQLIQKEERYSPELENKIKIIKTGDTLSEKIQRGGSLFGHFTNKAIKQYSDADICLMLCDDDALHKDYLEQLNRYYLDNLETIYSYCKVSIFDPKNFNCIEDLYKVPQLQNPSDHGLNIDGELDTACCYVDASQVSWRRENFIKDDLAFASPKTRDLDADIYTKMSNAWGGCKENKILGQYKAWFSDQLGRRPEEYEVVHD